MAIAARRVSAADATFISARYKADGICFSAEAKYDQHSITIVAELCLHRIYLFCKRSLVEGASVRMPRLRASAKRHTGDSLPDKEIRFN